MNPYKKKSFNHYIEMLREKNPKIPESMVSLWGEENESDEDSSSTNDDGDFDDDKGSMTYKYDNTYNFKPDWLIDTKPEMKRSQISMMNITS